MCGSLRFSGSNCRVRALFNYRAAEEVCIGSLSLFFYYSCFVRSLLLRFRGVSLCGENERERWWARPLSTYDRSIDRFERITCENRLPGFTTNLSLARGILSLVWELCKCNGRLWLRRVSLIQFIFIAGVTMFDFLLRFFRFVIFYCYHMQKECKIKILKINSRVLIVKIQTFWSSCED